MTLKLRYKLGTWQAGGGLTGSKELSLNSGAVHFKDGTKKERRNDSHAGEKIVENWRSDREILAVRVRVTG